MTVTSRVLICVAAIGLAATASWGQTPRVVSVPVEGQYWEPAAGGLLHYVGTMTFTWTKNASNADGDWPVKATFRAQAWNLSTGAGYSLFGVCSDCLSAAGGGERHLVRSFIALDGEGQPEFEGTVNLTFSLAGSGTPPVVTAVAFGW